MVDAVLRCWRVPAHVGKVVRHAIRRHWGVSHHASHAIYHAAIGTMLVCAAVPGALWAFPPAAPPAVEVAAPPWLILPPGDLLPGGRDLGPADLVPDQDFGPGGGFVPASNLVTPTKWSRNDVASASSSQQTESPPPRRAASVASLLLETVTLPAVSVPIVTLPVSTVVAEPSSLVVFATAVLALVMLRRNRSRRGRVTRFSECDL